MSSERAKDDDQEAAASCQWGDEQQQQGRKENERAQFASFGNACGQREQQRATVARKEKSSQRDELERVSGAQVGAMAAEQRALASEAAKSRTRRAIRSDQLAWWLAQLAEGGSFCAERQCVGGGERAGGGQSSAAARDQLEWGRPGEKWARSSGSRSSGRQAEAEVQKQKQQNEAEVEQAGQHQVLIASHSQQGDNLSALSASSSLLSQLLNSSLNQLIEIDNGSSGSSAWQEQELGGKECFPAKNPLQQDEEKHEDGAPSAAKAAAAKGERRASVWWRGRRARREQLSAKVAQWCARLNVEQHERQVCARVDERDLLLVPASQPDCQPDYSRLGLARAPLWRAQEWPAECESRWSLASSGERAAHQLERLRQEIMLNRRRGRRRCNSKQAELASDFCRPDSAPNSARKSGSQWSAGGTDNWARCEGHPDEALPTRVCGARKTDKRQFVTFDKCTYCCRSSSGCKCSSSSSSCSSSSSSGASFATWQAGRPKRPLGATAEPRRLAARLARLSSGENVTRGGETASGGELASGGGGGLTAEGELINGPPQRSCTGDWAALETDAAARPKEPRGGEAAGTRSAAWPPQTSSGECAPHTLVCSQSHSCSFASPERPFGALQQDGLPTPSAHLEANSANWAAELRGSHAATRKLRATYAQGRQIGPFHEATLGGAESRQAEAEAEPVSETVVALVRGCSGPQEEEEEQLRPIGGQPESDFDGEQEKWHEFALGIGERTGQKAEGGAQTNASHKQKQQVQVIQSSQTASDNNRLKLAPCSSCCSSSASSFSSGACSLGCIQVTTSENSSEEGGDKLAKGPPLLGGARSWSDESIGAHKLGRERLECGQKVAIGGLLAIGQKLHEQVEAQKEQQEQEKPKQLETERNDAPEEVGAGEQSWACFHSMGLVGSSGRRVAPLGRSELVGQEARGPGGELAREPADLRGRPSSPLSPLSGGPLEPIDWRGGNEQERSLEWLLVGEQGKCSGRPSGAQAAQVQSEVQGTARAPDTLRLGRAECAAEHSAEEQSAAAAKQFAWSLGAKFELCQNNQQTFALLPTSRAPNSNRQRTTQSSPDSRPLNVAREDPAHEPDENRALFSLDPTQDERSSMVEAVASLARVVTTGANTPSSSRPASRLELEGPGREPIYDVPSCVAAAAARWQCAEASLTPDSQYPSGASLASPKVVEGRLERDCGRQQATGAGDQWAFLAGSHAGQLERCQSSGAAEERASGRPSRTATGDNCSQGAARTASPAALVSGGQRLATLISRHNGRANNELQLVHHEDNNKCDARRKRFAHLAPSGMQSSERWPAEQTFGGKKQEAAFEEQRQSREQQVKQDDGAWNKWRGTRDTGWQRSGTKTTEISASLTFQALSEGQNGHSETRRKTKGGRRKGNENGDENGNENAKENSIKSGNWKSADGKGALESGEKMEESTRSASCCCCELCSCASATSSLTYSSLGSALSSADSEQRRASLCCSSTATSCARPSIVYLAGSSCCRCPNARRLHSSRARRCRRLAGSARRTAGHLLRRRARLRRRRPCSCCGGGLASGASCSCSSAATTLLRRRRRARADRRPLELGRGAPLASDSPGSLTLEYLRRRRRRSHRQGAAGRRARRRRARRRDCSLCGLLAERGLRPDAAEEEPLRRPASCVAARETRASAARPSGRMGGSHAIRPLAAPLGELPELPEVAEEPDEPQEEGERRGVVGGGAHSQSRGLCAAEGRAQRSAASTASACVRCGLAARARDPRPHSARRSSHAHPSRALAGEETGRVELVERRPAGGGRQLARGLALVGRRRGQWATIGGYPAFVGEPSGARGQLGSQSGALGKHRRRARECLATSSATSASLVTSLSRAAHLLAWDRRRRRRECRSGGSTATQRGRTRRTGLLSGGGGGEREISARQLHWATVGQLRDMRRALIGCRPSGNDARAAADRRPQQQQRQQRQQSGPLEPVQRQTTVKQSGANSQRQLIARLRQHEINIRKMIEMRARRQAAMAGRGRASGHRSLGGGDNLLAEGQTLAAGGAEVEVGRVGMRRGHKSIKASLDVHDYERRNLERLGRRLLGLDDEEGASCLCGDDGPAEGGPSGLPARLRRFRRDERRRPSPAGELAEVGQSFSNQRKALATGRPKTSNNLPDVHHNHNHSHKQQHQRSPLVMGRSLLVKTKSEPHEPISPLDPRRHAPPPQEQLLQIQTQPQPQPQLPLTQQPMTTRFAWQFANQCQCKHCRLLETLVRLDCLHNIRHKGSSGSNTHHDNHWPKLYKQHHEERSPPTIEHNLNEDNGPQTRSPFLKKVPVI